MICWEYKIKYILREEYSSRDLDFLGKDGWELVSVYDGKAFFKRPLK